MPALTHLRHLIASCEVAMALAVSSEVYIRHAVLRKRLIDKLEKIEFYNYYS